MAKGNEASQSKARLKDKGKGKEAKTLLETHGPEVAPKAKEIAPKVADPLVSQLASKEDPPTAKA